MSCHLFVIVDIVFDYLICVHPIHFLFRVASVLLSLFCFRVCSVFVLSFVVVLVSRGRPCPCCVSLRLSFVYLVVHPFSH